MKQIIILLIIYCVFNQELIYSQVINFSKDSIFIEGEGFYEDIKDSIYIKNIGEVDLIIDTIYSNEIYSYNVALCKNNSIDYFYISFDKEQPPMIISPQDSIKLIFYMPDLCPICKENFFTYFQDTLYFVNNSINDSLYLLYISGQGLVSDVNTNDILIDKYLLEQNYPNPFNPSTIIKYTIPKTNFVSIKIYDILGKEISTLVNEEKSAGTYEVEFSGKGLSNGIYFYKLRAGDFMQVKKMLMLK